MKKLLLPALFALCITACGADTPTTLTYNVSFDTENTDRMNDLSLATRKVIERRLARIDGRLFDYDVKYNEETEETTIEVVVDSPESADVINAEMVAPFTFEFRTLVDEGQQTDSDIPVENMGYFRATGITKDDIDWVIGETTDTPEKTGRVLIGFNEAGIPKAKTLFTENEDVTIGIFARDRLIAAIPNPPKDFEQVIAIEGLPTGELAKVFADDMNVGIHMTFTKL